MRRHSKKILITIISVFISWILVSVFISYKLTHRAAEKYIEHTPKNYQNYIFKKIKITTDDSLKINGIMTYKESNTKFVLLLHGNGDDYSSNYELMDSLYNHNINSLAISLRCHGSSDGTINDIGFSAKYDVIGAVNFIKNISADSKIVVAGRSLGSAAAIFSYEYIGNNVNGLFLESPYYDLTKAVKYRLDYYLPFFIADIAFINLSLFSKLFISDMETISPFNYSKKMFDSKNVIFLAGDEDVKAPLSDIVKISKNVKYSRVLILNGAKHQSLFFYDKRKYLDELLDLCNE